MVKKIINLSTIKKTNVHTNFWIIEQSESKYTAGAPNEDIIQNHLT